MTLVSLFCRVFKGVEFGRLVDEDGGKGIPECLWACCTTRCLCPVDAVVVLQGHMHSGINPVGVEL